MKEATASGDQVLAGRISQFQFRDYAPRPHRKSLMWSTPACCLDTQKATSLNGFTGA